ncbi:MAG: sulfurtransferase [Candidatus Freyarchaeum deiterrae]
MEKKYPYGKGIVKWISTDWLMDHLEDKNFMILDTQPDIHDYIQEHIPNAVYMSEKMLRAPLRRMPGAYVSPDIAQLIYRRLGLRPNVPVIVYTGTGPFKGWGDGLEQTMVVYSLIRFGHNNVYVLDGGIDKWKAEEGTLTKVYTNVEESNFKVKVRREFFVEYEEFKKIKDNEDVLLLDARPTNVYEGQGPWIKPGHIPGAVNLPWASLMDDKNKRLLKPDDAIQSILDAHNATPDKNIICSCGTGREATNEFLLFKYYLSYPNVKIYEGSFTEWVDYPENPTVVGKSPR